MNRPNRLLWIALAALALSLGACSDDATSDGDTGGDAGGDTADTTPDTTPDGEADMEPDMVGDMEPDTVADMEPDMEPVVLRDLEVQMSGMDPHVDQLMEFRVVSSDGTLVSRGILDPLTVATFTWFQPDAAPEGAGYTLDFTADLNGNGAYDAPPADHAWRLALPETGTATVTFDHNTDFTDIGASATTEGGDFTLAITSLNPHIGQRFELRVIVADTGQVVGHYLLDEVAGADFDVEIPGVIENGVAYQVDFTADLNGNTVYDPPPADHAWRLTGTGTASGLSLSFSHNTNFTDVGF